MSSTSQTRLYVVYDCLAACAIAFGEQPNDECAMRAFSGFAKAPGLDLTTFEVRCVGDFDHDSCTLTQPLPCSTNLHYRLVCNLSELQPVTPAVDNNAQ